jgi:beta-glucuronidase
LTPHILGDFMRRFLLFFLLATISQAQSSQVQTPLIANVSGRKTTSLNGAWHIIVDPLESGLNAGYYLNHKPKDKRELVEYDFEASETLSVPGDWNTQKEKLLFYEGSVWYEKS